MFNGGIMQNRRVAADGNFLCVSIVPNNIPAQSTRLFVICAQIR